MKTELDPEVIQLLEQEHQFVRTLFYDVSEYIKLFKPEGWKSEYYRWAETVETIFTQGYCFNFAMALKMTFGHLFDCKIIGTGVIPDDAVNWRITRKEICNSITALDFNHFICRMTPPPPNEQHTRDVDIYGVFIPTFEWDEYTYIVCSTDEQKMHFRSALNCTSQRAFAKKYPLREGTITWKVFWTLNEGEIAFKKAGMKALEEKSWRR